MLALSSDSEHDLTKAIRWPCEPISSTKRPDVDEGKLSDCIEVTGWFGSIQKGFLKTTREPVAIKTIKVGCQARRKSMFREIEELVRADVCPYLVKLYGPFTREKVHVHIVMAFMDCGGLAKHIKRCKDTGVPPQHLSCIARQITLGLMHLHGRMIIHRNITPENILHNVKGEVKLGDFGISIDLDYLARPVMPTCVTYMSPERACGEDYSYVTDIWSVGMVAYELAAGRHPFESITYFPYLYEALVEKPEPRLDDEIYPPGLCCFVAQCLMREMTPPPVVLAKRGSPRALSNEGSVSQKLHVIVTSMAGEHIFGPAELESPLSTSELARLIFEYGGIPRKRCQFLLDSRVLEDGKDIPRGEADELVVLTCVVGCPCRPEADELIRHPFLRSDCGPQDAFAAWLATISQ